MGRGGAGYHTEHVGSAQRISPITRVPKYRDFLKVVSRSRATQRRTARCDSERLSASFPARLAVPAAPFCGCAAGSPRERARGARTLRD